MNFFKARSDFFLKLHTQTHTHAYYICIDLCVGTYCIHLTYKYIIHIQHIMKPKHESIPSFSINGKRRSQFNDTSFDYMRCIQNWQILRLRTRRHVSNQILK